MEGSTQNNRCKQQNVTEDHTYKEKSPINVTDCARELHLLVVPTTGDRFTSLESSSKHHIIYNAPNPYYKPSSMQTDITSPVHVTGGFALGAQNNV